MDINKITVSYELNGVETTLAVNNPFSDPDNIIRNLPHLFERVIRDTGANPSLVIEGLQNAFAYDVNEEG